MIDSSFFVFRLTIINLYFDVCGLILIWFALVCWLRDSFDFADCVSYT